MAIEVGGKTYRYYPYDAFYVNGQQVKEAWFNGVKYYPHDMDIQSIRFASVPTGYWVFDSPDDEDPTAEFDMSDAVVEAVNANGETFVIPHNELEFSGGREANIFRSHNVVAGHGGGGYIYGEDGTSGSIIGGFVGGSSWMTPRVTYLTGFFVKPSSPTTLSWIRAVLAMGKLYENSRPSGMVGFVRARYGSYDSGLKYLYASYADNYRYITYKGEDATVGMIGPYGFSASNFGLTSFLEGSYSIPINVTEQSPRDLMAAAVGNENPEQLGFSIGAMWERDGIDYWANGYMHIPPLNYP